MTCIVGMVDKSTGDVYLGGDSAAVSDYDMLTISQSKVLVKGQYAFGFAGHFRFGQIIKSIFEPPVYTGQVPVEDWLAGEFAEHLRHTVKVLGYGKSRDGRDEGGHALVAFQGRLFLMQDEFDFCETRDGMAALGVGDKYALGAIKALSAAKERTDDIGNQLPLYTTEEMVLKALEISEFYNGGVRSPFSVVKLGLLDGQPAKASRRNTRGDRGAKKAKPRSSAKRSR